MCVKERKWRWSNINYDCTDEQQGATKCRRKDKTIIEITEDKKESAFEQKNE